MRNAMNLFVKGSICHLFTVINHKMTMRCHQRLRKLSKGQNSGFTDSKAAASTLHITQHHAIIRGSRWERTGCAGAMEASKQPGADMLESVSPNPSNQNP